MSQAMTKTTVDILPDLTDKLAALGATDTVFEASARQIATGGGAAALAAILAEIDNTVLERVLVFQLGDVSVSCSVAGRRLRGVIAAPDADDITGQVLSRDDDDRIATVGTLLTHLCDAAPRVLVRSLPPVPFGNTAETGISANYLLQAWQVDANAPVQSPIDRFLAAHAGKMTGTILQTSDQAPIRSGDTAALDPVWDQPLQALPEPAAGDPQMACFDGALGAGIAVAVLRAEDRRGLCAFASADLPLLAAAWRKLVG